MTPEEREQVDRLVERMKVEKDQNAFRDLVKQFQEIISRKESRLRKPEELP
jgi:predicted  nucleic acid-binding Zn-ribbon protein